MFLFFSCPTLKNLKKKKPKTKLKTKNSSSNIIKTYLGSSMFSVPSLLGVWPQVTVAASLEFSFISGSLASGPA